METQCEEDTVRDELQEMDRKIGDLISKADDKLDRVEFFFQRAKGFDAYGEERLRLEDEVIEPMEETQELVEETLKKLEGGSIAAPQAQKILDSVVSKFEDAEAANAELDIPQLEDAEEDDL